jgi:hypothetical protein
MHLNFTHLVATCGSWAVQVFAAIQCAGTPFPGGAVLLAAAMYAGITHQLALAPIILAAAVGAIPRHLLGFLLGSRGGYRLLAHHGHLLRLDERKLKLGNGYRVGSLLSGRLVASSNRPTGHRVDGAGPLSVCNLFRHLAPEYAPVRRRSGTDASRSS